MPILMFTILFAVQFCLIYLGEQVASGAAREAARSARVTGSGAAGQAAAERVIGEHRRRRARRARSSTRRSPATRRAWSSAATPARSCRSCRWRRPRDRRGPGRAVRARQRANAVRRDERGSMAVEIVVLIPVLFMFTLFVVAGGRYVNARADADSTARDAARAASVAHTRPTPRTPYARRSPRACARPATASPPGSRATSSPAARRSCGCTAPSHGPTSGCSGCQGDPRQRRGARPDRHLPEHAP